MINRRYFLGMMTIASLFIFVACGGGETSSSEAESPKPQETTSTASTEAPTQKAEEPKKEEPKAEPKKEEPKPEPKKEEPKPEPKKEEPKPEPTPAPIILPSADLFTNFSACGWDSSYAIDSGSLFLSSTETPGSKSVGNLNLDFMPSMVGQTHSNLKNQTLGFAFHDYTRTELDINKSIHMVAIPAGKTPFKLDLNIAVSGKGSDGNSCSTTITEQFTRSDDFYPSAELSIPSNAIPDKDKYKPFSIPAPTAQALFLATSQSNYDDNYGKVRVNNTEGYFWIRTTGINE